MMKIGVLGCGAMSSAVVKGISRHHPDVSFYTYTPSKIRAQQLARDVGGFTIENLKECRHFDYVIIACKPYQFNELAKSLEEVDLKNVVLVSIMAAIDTSTIQRKTGANKVIRLMPSLPMNYDQGISLFYKNDAVENEQLDRFRSILSNSSKTYTLESEEKFDKLTVVTSSGPAYIYYLIDSFKTIIEDFEVDNALAKELSCQLFMGSVQSVSLDPTNIKEKIDQVTSHKGVTIEAINSFKNDKLDKVLSDGITSALDRSTQIAREL